jgi:hypothetical protein
LCRVVLGERRGAVSGAMGRAALGRGTLAGVVVRETERGIIVDEFKSRSLSADAAKLDRCAIKGRLGKEGICEDRRGEEREKQREGEIERGRREERREEKRREKEERREKR